MTTLVSLLYSFLYNKITLFNIVILEVNSIFIIVNVIIFNIIIITNSDDDENGDNNDNDNEEDEDTQVTSDKCKNFQYYFKDLSNSITIYIL